MKKIIITTLIFIGINVINAVIPRSVDTGSYYDEYIMPILSERTRAVFITSTVMYLIFLFENIKISKYKVVKEDDKNLSRWLLGTTFLIFVVLFYIIATVGDELMGGYGTVGSLNFGICGIALLIFFDDSEEVSQPDPQPKSLIEAATSSKSNLLKEEIIEEKNSLDYSTMTVVELKKIAKERNINGISNLKKNELIERLINSDNGE